MWMTNELLIKIWGLWSKFRWSLSPSKLEGPGTWGILGDFPFFMKWATCALIFSKSKRSSCAQPPPCSKGKEPPKLGIICERHWLLILAPPFGQHMKTPSKTSNANLTNNPTCLEYEVFICYFGPHGGEHHPTPVDTFHPCGLPPSGLQTHQNIRWQSFSG